MLALRSVRSSVRSFVKCAAGSALLASCLASFAAECKGDGGSHAISIDQPRSALEEGAVRSIESKTRASLQFVNLTEKDLQLFWLDFHGQRKAFGTIPAGKAVTKATYLTHTWLVTTKKGHGLAIFKPQGLNSTVLIDPMSAPKLGADAARLRSEGGGVATILKFVNPTSTPVDFYWVDFDGTRHKRGSVAAHSQLSQPTFSKHVWLVTSADGKSEAVFVAKESAQAALIAPNISETP